MQSIKSVLIVGFGVSGRAVARLCDRRGIDWKVYDSDDEVRSQIESEFGMAKIFDGNFSVDALVCSPSIAYDCDLLQSARRQSIRVMSEQDFGRHFCRSELIGVTGTNGKTTLTMLIAAALKNAGYSAYAVGNIGTPLSEIADTIAPHETAVAETSSFQLENSSAFDCDISVTLAIEPDHLNRHHTFERYVAAKLRLMQMQTDCDYAVTCFSDVNLVRAAATIDAVLIPFMPDGERLNEIIAREWLSSKIGGMGTVRDGAICFDERVYVSRETAERSNIHTDTLLAFACVCGVKGISPFIAEKTLREFRKPDFRLNSYNLGNRIIINDSKSTNVSALLYAVSVLKSDAALIVGGADTMEDYSPLFSSDFVRKDSDDNENLRTNEMGNLGTGENCNLRKVLDENGKHRNNLFEKNSRVAKIIAVGDNARAIFETAKRYGVTVEICADMTTACEAAWRSGLSCILFSPGAKSFDRYNGFEQRGRDFDNRIATLAGE